MVQLRGLAAHADFNPRPPCGGRHTYIEGGTMLHTDFNPRPPCGGRRLRLSRWPGLCSISIRALLAEGDGNAVPPHGRYGDFNPRPPCGGRHCQRQGHQGRPQFQSAPSLRRATALWTASTGAWTYFNPRPPCGGRRYNITIMFCRSDISIRALLAEGDSPAATGRACQRISIRALLAEGDMRSNWKRFRPIHFNPRPPCGGRPSGSHTPARAHTHFNPRPPCGGRQASCALTKR